MNKWSSINIRMLDAKSSNPWTYAPECDESYRFDLLDQ